MCVEKGFNRTASSGDQARRGGLRECAFEHVRKSDWRGREQNLKKRIASRRMCHAGGLETLTESGDEVGGKMSAKRERKSKDDTEVKKLPREVPSWVCKLDEGLLRGAFKCLFEGAREEEGLNPAGDEAKLCIDLAGADERAFEAAPLLPEVVVFG